MWIASVAAVLVLVAGAVLWWAPPRYLPWDTASFPDVDTSALTPTQAKVVDLLENEHREQRPELGERVADAWIRAQAYRLYTWGTVTRMLEGVPLGVEGSINKIFWSELDVRIHETALDLMGADGELAGKWQDGYLFSLSGPIYAGTNEIQRNIVAERMLGLPKADR